MALLVDVFAISDFHYDDANGLVFNGTDYAIVADTVLPKFPQFGTAQRFADGAGVLKMCKAITEKSQDTPCCLRIELMQILPGQVRKFNCPCHGSSSQQPVA